MKLPKRVRNPRAAVLDLAPDRRAACDRHLSAEYWGMMSPKRPMDDPDDIERLLADDLNASMKHGPYPFESISAAAPRPYPTGAEVVVFRLHLRRDDDVGRARDVHQYRPWPSAELIMMMMTMDAVSTHTSVPREVISIYFSGAALR